MAVSFALLTFVALLTAMDLSHLMHVTAGHIKRARTVNTQKSVIFP